MKKAITGCLFFVLCSLLFACMPARQFFLVYADDCNQACFDQLTKEIDDLKRALQMSISATNPLEKNLEKLQTQLEGIKAKISQIEKEVERKDKEVKEGEKLLGIAQELLSGKVRSFYKSSLYYGANGMFFLLSGSLSESLRVFSYQKKVIENDRDTIVKVVLYIKDLEQKKKELETEKVGLAKVKEETDVQAAFLQKEVGSAKKYQAELSKKIAELTVRQQQIIAEKFASLNLPTSLGGGPLYCTDDRKIDPGFSNAFAFFTFGIPHRVGMNQYGVYGRAKKGQSYQDILRAYFEGINFEKKDPNTKIKVQGYGEKKLEEYLLGIYEMPSDWPLEALKAQVVAARSYALAYTGGGEREICTTQACQVYKGGNKGGDWEKAVKETEGEVVVKDGQAITAWYSSTDGGYTYLSSDVGWSYRPWTKRLRDTDGEINSFSDLFNKAYDRDSPCFYAAQGFRSEYGKSAWLKEEEVADIANVLMLAKKDSGTQTHLSQPDRPNPDGVETWDRERVKQELKNRGSTPYSSVSNISIDWDKNLGKTTSITISGDGGTNSFDGSEFRNFFNLRAPANIQIVGPLYNVERK